MTFNLRYPGQYYDKESNLHYNYFRSYSAERGRYTQADPIGLGGGFNRFSYVQGNPIKRMDFYGLAPGDPFTSQDSAAQDAMEYFRGLPDVDKIEYAAAIYYDGVACKYRYTEARTLGKNNRSVVPIHLIPKGNHWTGDIHNHPSDIEFEAIMAGINPHVFSKIDVDDMTTNGIRGYLITPRWKLINFFANY